MAILDCHTHYFSRTFFETLAQLSPLVGEPDQKLQALVERTGIELPPADPASHLARWIAELDEHGIEHAVTFASIEEEIPVVRDAVRRAAGRMTAITILNPKTPLIGEELWSLLTEEGFRGVLLFPAMHHFRMEEAETVLKEVDDRGGLVYVHCGMLRIPLRDHLSLPRPYDMGRYGRPLDIIRWANRFARAKFIIPHFGAGFFRETLMLGSLCDNVYVDTSSSNGWLKTDPAVLDLKEVFFHALGVFGPERMLFGTDSGIFPKGWRKDIYETQKGILDELAVPAADQELIFSGNLRRLLGV